MNALRQLGLQMDEGLGNEVERAAKEMHEETAAASPYRGKGDAQGLASPSADSADGEGYELDEEDYFDEDDMDEEDAEGEGEGEGEEEEASGEGEGEGEVLERTI